MIRFAIYDDAQWIKVIKEEIIEHMTEAHMIDTFTNAKDLLLHHQRRAYDIVLLGIKKPGITEFDTGRMIKLEDPDCILCFITDHESFVKLGYQYNIFRFISKSCLSVDIKEMLAKAITKLQKERNIVVVKQNRSIHRVQIKEILYVETRGNYLELNTTSVVYSYRKTIKSFMETYGINFIQISRGIAVNNDKIKKIDFLTNEIFLYDSEEILYVTKKYRGPLKKKYAVLV